MRSNVAVLFVASVLLAGALAAGCGGDASSNLGPEPDAGASPDAVAAPHDAGIHHDATSSAPEAGIDAPALPPPPPDDAGGVDASTPADAGMDSGGGVDAGLDAGGSANDGGFVGASHPPFPRIIGGNTVITNPKVVAVTFSGYDNADAAQKMIAGLPTVTMPDGQQFWTAAVSEYGVGPLTVLPPVALTEAAPTTDTDPAAFVTGLVNTNAAFANVDTSTIVALFYPKTTPLGGSCADPTTGGIGYGGYHDVVSVTKGQIPYAVMVECDTFGPITNSQDMITVAGSHEIIEASTDPAANGYSALDTSSASGWAMHVLLQGNEENGDMCAVNAGFGRAGGSYPYLISRGWSNAAAAAGNLDPCQPAMLPAQPFVGAFPVMNDVIHVNFLPGKGALIPVGSSKTFEVDCFSFQQTVPFTVGAHQSRAIQPPQLAFAFDKTTCSNGDKVNLTITVNSKGSGGVEAFSLYAQLPGVADAQKAAWAGVVAQQ